MDKRAQVLCMGLLVKSPKKSPTKANLAAFWQVRWCVFTKITYDGAPQKTKLMLIYYKDQERHRGDKKCEGAVNITECMSIRSYYFSKAGFHHVFVIKQSNGKDVYFSAPSCQLKSKWIIMLYSYKFNSSITGAGQPWTSSLERCRSETSRASNSTSLETSRKDSIDSGTFSRTLTINSHSSTGSNSSQEEHSETPPPLPKPRGVRARSSSTVDEAQLLDAINWISSKSPMSPRRSNSDQLDVSSSEDKMRMQSIVDALFPWCKSCDELVHKKKSIKKTMSLKGAFSSSSKKKKSLKKSASFHVQPIPASSPNQPRNQTSPNRCSSNASISSDGSASRDSFFEEEDDSVYTDIAEDWIQQVRKKLEDDKEKTAEAADTENNDLSDVGNDNDNDDDGDDDDYDDVLYVDMNVIRKEMQTIKISESSTGADEPSQAADRSQTENEGLKRENHTLRKMLQLLQASNPKMLPADDVETETKIAGNLVFEMTI